jgi:hypothetical protein
MSSLSNARQLPKEPIFVNFREAGTHPGQLERGSEASLEDFHEKHDISEIKASGNSTGTSTASSETKEERGSSDGNSSSTSEFAVSWSEPADQDPENPLNWSSTKKWVNILSISIIGFLV